MNTDKTIDLESLKRRMSRDIHAAQRGGDLKQMASFLATDEVPETLFGIPVITNETGYTKKDLAFFREHPEAGGYYDMGEEQAGTTGAIKAGEQRDPSVYETGSRVIRSVDQNPAAYDGEVPEGYIKKDDGWYVTEDYRKSWLDTPEEGSKAAEAYAMIQQRSIENHGRELDHEVALIRARLAAGDIDRGKAIEIAKYLRHRRDLAIAARVMRDYASATGVDIGRLTPEMFYVDHATADTRSGKFREQMLRDANDASKYTDKQRAYLAARWGFSKELADQETTVYNQEADNPANYPKDPRWFGPKRKAAAAARARIRDEQTQLADLKAREVLDKAAMRRIQRRTEYELSRLGFSASDKEKVIYDDSMFLPELPRYVTRRVPTWTGRYIDPSKEF